MSLLEDSAGHFVETHGVWFRKSLPVEALVGVLTALPPTTHVEANRVGNLCVWNRHPTEPDADIVGYIDFAEESYTVVP